MHHKFAHSHQHYLQTELSLILTFPKGERHKSQILFNPHHLRSMIHFKSTLKFSENGQKGFAMYNKLINCTYKYGNMLFHFHSNFTKLLALTLILTSAYYREKSTKH